MKKFITIAERNQEAKAAEEAGDIGKAIALYQENIAENYPDAFSFNRLMILHRKNKNYKEELEVIKKGIELFKAEARRPLEENITEKKNKAQLKKLSEAFMKGTGLIDKKGNEVHYAEPINKWMQRKLVVEKKLKSKKKK